ncbi:MAG: hypothetical protein AVDCRST_MAG56-681 [uncultured Cytophagales bacterium]|uniref:Uncharacterized protein n=1 Tax=uncultured Cytophagales bacterium TaxID=158755 RepID=A0A6J4HC94_9SPHI|nr:MAG: hypothetical protein AVDCRST_MAG56-681 [uncultured Cytophagales bacterium]
MQLVPVLLTRLTLNRFDKAMKISKTLLQAIAVAVTITTVATSCNEEQPGPEDGKTKEQPVPYDCPGCGMG